MKKLIALMMCAMLLLSGCAAVTAEGPGIGFQIGDLVVNTASGETLDLTGLSVTFETAESDTAVGSRTVISVDGQQRAELVWATVGQYLYLSLPGTEGDHSYALDLAKVVQVLSEAFSNIAEQLSGIIPAIFPGTGESAQEAPSVEDMTEEELQAALEELQAAMAEMQQEQSSEDAYLPEAQDDEAVLTAPDMSEELMQAQQQMQEKLNEIMARCMSVDITQIDGEDFQVITFDLSQEDMAELIDALPSIFLFSSDGKSGLTLGDIIDAADVSLAMRGAVTGSQDFSRFEIDAAYDVGVAGKEVSFTFNLDNMAGNGVTAVSLGLEKDGQSSGISLRLAPTVTEDAGWLPAELGEDTLILTEMSLEQVGQVLSDGYSDYIALLESIGDSVAEANLAD